MLPKAHVQSGLLCSRTESVAGNADKKLVEATSIINHEVLTSSSVESFPVESCSFCFKST
jgi:hypothetical protein